MAELGAVHEVNALLPLAKDQPLLVDMYPLVTLHRDAVVALVEVRP